MGEHIDPAGWHNWDNASNEETAFYAEYMSHGVDVSGRVSWSKQLTEAEAALYVFDNVFAGEDGHWTPVIPTSSGASKFLNYHQNLFLTLMGIITVAAYRK